MRINFLNRALWATAHCILILLLHPSLTFAEESTDVDPAIFVDATEALRAGEALENNRQWVEAINHYEAVLERFEKDEGLSYGLRRTRIHFGVDRRYSDRSFEEKLLAKGRAEALDLFEDILTRIQYEYVDPVTVTRFVSHGTESLYMALKNERFISKNIRGEREEAINRVRQSLIQSFWNRPVENRMAARSMISSSPAT